MKIKRSQLEQIVKEELMRHLSEQLLEAEPKPADVEDGDENKKSKEKSGGKGEKGKTEPQVDIDNATTKPKTTGKPAGEPEGEPPTQELPDDPADDELETDVADPEAEESEEDPADGAKNDISDELSGKTIQAITMEPKSKMMPGAIEVNITFDQVADTFRILIGKSGAVKFFWRGLHNSL